MRNKLTFLLVLVMLSLSAIGCIKPTKDTRPAKVTLISGVVINCDKGIELISETLLKGIELSNKTWLKCYDVQGKTVDVEWKFLNSYVVN